MLSTLTLGIGTDALISIAVVAFLFLLLVVIVAGEFLNLWIQAMLYNAPVGAWHMIEMRLKKADVRLIIFQRIRAAKVGVDIPAKELEVHSRVSSNLPEVVSAIIKAQNDGIRLPWHVAAEMDLKGLDVMAEVERAFAEHRDSLP